VKPLPQAERIKQQPHRLVPEAAAAAAESSDVQRFAFDQPSPDDVVLAAQQNKGVAGKGLGRPAAKQQRQQQQRRGDAQAAAGLSAGVRGLNLNGQQPTEGAVPSADAAAPQQAAAPRRRRPLAEYQPEGELAAECAAAAAAEAAGGGAKPRLHLVVLGHVDAGKSTLMGRTLYELGLLSERTVQRTQREAAASGKASFAWAWMLDERPEERARGVTVDVAVSRWVRMWGALVCLRRPLTRCTDGRLPQARSRRPPLAAASTAARTHSRHPRARPCCAGSRRRSAA
jgi:hypothetical protein